MFQSKLKLHHLVEGITKAKRGSALAFFLCAFTTAPLTYAQTNWVEGTAYGTNDLSMASSITSLSDGTGLLIIGYSNTTSLTLDHAIDGYILLTNGTPNFTITASTNAVVTGSDGAVLTVIGATNLSVTGGSYLGTNSTTSTDTGGPPIPGLGDTAAGALFRDSSATIESSTFAGAVERSGLIIQASDITLTDVAVHGGNGGTGLFAISNSTVTINSGSYTGQTGSSAFYLQDSSATVQDGVFEGDVGGTPGTVYGDGLFSLMNAASTNRVELYGGTFSSVAFAGVDGAVQNFLAGTNLVIENGITQNGGTVVVTNLSDDPLQDISILTGDMIFQDSFTLNSNGIINLASTASRAAFSSGITVGSGAVLANGLGRVDVSGSYIQLAGSELLLAINAETNGLISATDAVFQPNAVIEVDATEAGFTSGTNEVTLITTSTGITGVDDIEVEAYTLGRVSFDDIYLDGANNLVFRFSTRALQDYWDVSGQMVKLADELEASGNQELFSAINAYDDPEQSSRAVEQTYFTTFNNFQTALQGMRAAVGPALSRTSQFREQLKLMPPGANGPERNNTLRGWAKYYGQYFTHDDAGINPNYDTVLHGGVAGIDTSVGNLMFGVSGGSSHYRMASDNQAQSDTTAYHGSLYGIYGMDRAYIDAGLAYGWNRVDTRTADPFRLEGSFDSDVVSAYFGGGYDLIDTEGGTVFTPEAALQYSMYEQDGYTETGTAAVPRVVDAFDADSLLSTLGMNVSMLEISTYQTFACKADLRMHWMHEFNPDPSNMTFTLQDGSESYYLAYPSLDEDLFRLGIGCSFFNTERLKPKNILFRIDFDELFGDGFNSHNLSAKVVYVF